MSTTVRDVGIAGATTPRPSHQAAGVTAALAVLALVAVLVRLPQLGELPNEFHPTRQYHSALIVRDWLGRLHPSTLDLPPDRTVSVSEPVIEPPVNEVLATVGDLLTGGEHLWIPRVIGIIEWVAAGWVIARLAGRLTSGLGSIAAAGAFWFLPYSVAASRAFQPEPLLLLLMAVALAATVRHDEVGGRRSLLVAGALGGAAVLVKAVAVFQLAAVTAALALRRRGRAAVRDAGLWLYAAMLVVPVAVWTVGGVVTGLLDAPADRRFFPSLYLDAPTWAAWWGRVLLVATIPGVVLVAVGLIVARGRTRVVLAGMAAGYVAYGLVFLYHSSSHDYYAEQLLLVVAVAAAVVVTAIGDRLSNPTVRRLAAGVGGAVLAAFVINALAVARAPVPRADDAQVAGIAAATAGDDRALYLAPDYGLELIYRIGLPGSFWPYEADVELERRAGAPARTTDERLDDLIARYDPDVFVVAPDPAGDDTALRAALDGRFAVRDSGPGWVVYDLRRPR